MLAACVRAPRGEQQQQRGARKSLQLERASN
jgi:hypothetical protein